jgi:hypothetical protein
MFVIDLLHEVELGAIKGVITQLIRIMYSLGGDTITIFNKRCIILQYLFYMQSDTIHRFRDVPTFGRDTIRKFHANVSDMKKLAARDFEDILQVRTFNIMSHWQKYSHGI